MNPEQNLDYLAAKHAQKTVEAGLDENLITKTLGVLQENGVYACFLYLMANNSSTAVDQILDMLKEKAFGFNPPPRTDTDATDTDALEFATYITADLQRLLLAKECLEQMLIYARYGAKAADKQ
ncbi:MAG: hypothetical protein DRI56_12530 [Chloroflexota bacterium]|nr:MAG: hypothetical protein DRI56_12530 [Chloroflexota bacterium]